MSEFIITPYTNSFEISEDGHAKEYQRGVLSYDDDPNNDQILDINTTQSRQRLYRIDLDKDTLNIDGTTAFADSDAIKTALRPFFFRSVAGGGPSTDEFVKATVNDTTAAYLLNKLISTDGSISLTVDNPGGDENVDLKVVGGVGAVYENTLYVSENGDDTTGARNDTTKPYLTIAAAFADSVDGDSIIIYPGSYNVNSNIGNKSINIIAPFGDVIINSFSNINVLYDNLGPVNFTMKGDIKWVSTRRPFNPGTNYGSPVWWFQNAASNVNIDVEYCEKMRIKFNRLVGSYIVIRSSEDLAIEGENLTNTVFEIGDSYQFSWCASVNNIGASTGVLVKALGGRARLTKDTSFIGGGSTNRHRSIIYQDNGGGSTPAAAFRAEVTFENFDVISPRNTVNLNPSMSYTFDNCYFETDRTSGGGDVMINNAGSNLGKKITVKDCRFRCAVAGGVGYKAQFSATNGTAEGRFIGTNVIQVTAADSLQGVLAAGTYDLIGELLCNTAPNANMTNNIVGTNVLVDANITIK